MVIEVGVTGKIISGEKAGQYIKVINDAENTGGYLILTSLDDNLQVGYDDWVENEVKLGDYFIDMMVEWDRHDS